MPLADTLIPSPRLNVAGHATNQLSRIGWDFTDAKASRQSIHSFHSYPARFIPEIPRTVIREPSPPRDSLVLDPFCGCGNTLVEAQHAGYLLSFLEVFADGQLKLKEANTKEIKFDEVVEKAKQAAVLVLVY